MRYSFVAPLIVALAFLAGSQNANAQAQNPNGCYNYPPKMGLCQLPSGGTCSRQVPTVQASDGLGWAYIWQQTVCCGETAYYPYEFETTCQITELKDLDTLRRILALPGHERFEVAGCDGFLRPLPHLFVTNGEYPGSRTLHSPDSRAPFNPTTSKIL